MAEFVELNLEKHCVADLEKFLALKLFEPVEIKKLAQQRRDITYNLMKRTKDKNDYLCYIRFEKELIQKIKQKRLELGKNKKINEVYFKLITRLHMNFRRTVMLWQADIDLWMDYFRFCNNYKLFREGNKMLLRLFQVHSDKENLWMFASRWAIKKTRGGKADYEAGRSWLIKGLTRHPKSKDLYTALIQFDLELASKAKEDSNNDVMKKALACAEVSYKNAIKNIPDANFVTDLITLIVQHPAADELRQLAYGDLEGFSESEAAWKARALRALEEEKPSDDGLDIAEMIDHHIGKCIDTFKIAVERVPTKLMWKHYLDFLKEAVNQNKTNFGQLNLRSTLYHSVLPGMIAANQASPDEFIFLADYYLSEGNIDSATNTLKLGLDRYPDHAALWHELIRVYLSGDKVEDGMAAFYDARVKLKNLEAIDTLRIWTMVIGYLSADTNQEQMGTTNEETMKQKIESIYEDAIRYRVDLANLMKPRYLQWRFLTFGLDSARDLLKQTYVTNPPCLEFYQKMIEIESNQKKPDLIRIRNLFETVLRLFGTKNTGLWMSYMNFEKDHGDIKNVTKIYTRGLKTLNKEFVDDFVASYAVSF